MSLKPNAKIFYRKFRKRTQEYQHLIKKRFKKPDIEIEQKNFEISKIRNYICQETGGKPLKFNNMAMSIKEIPVLTGQCAVDFVSAADANSQNQTPKLTTQQADRIKDVMEKSKSFSFSN